MEKQSKRLWKASLTFFVKLLIAIWKISVTHFAKKFGLLEHYFCYNYSYGYICITVQGEINGQLMQVVSQVHRKWKRENQKSVQWGLRSKRGVGYMNTYKLFQSFTVFRKRFPRRLLGAVGNGGRTYREYVTD